MGSIGVATTAEDAAVEAMAEEGMVTTAGVATTAGEGTAEEVGAVMAGEVTEVVVVVAMEEAAVVKQPVSSDESKELEIKHPSLRHVKNTPELLLNSREQSPVGVGGRFTSRPS